MDLLDDLFERAAEADEPPELNYIRKHALKLEAAGVERGSARLFSNPAGDYGSLVNERVGNGDWEEEEELSATWQSRNAFSFGRAGEKGVNRAAVLEELLATTDRVVQEIDSVEYGLTDINEYYANTVRSCFLVFVYVQASSPLSLLEPNDPYLRPTLRPTNPLNMYTHTHTTHNHRAR